TAMGMEGPWFPNGRSCARVCGFSCAWVQCPVEKRVCTSPTLSGRCLEPVLSEASPFGCGRNRSGRLRRIHGAVPFPFRAGHAPTEVEASIEDEPWPGPRPATARCSTVPIGTAPVDQASGLVEAVTHADATVDDQDQTTVTAALGPGLLDTRPVQRTTDQLGTARSGEEQPHRQQSGHCAEC